MDLELKDKVVVISGAAGIKGSIGETMVRHLVNEGAIPAIIDRNDRGCLLYTSPSPRDS